MEENKLAIEKTVRWFATSSIDSDVSDVWLVLHGYGQLGNRFLGRFENFSGKQRVWIAPEGMHRFYLNGSSGKIGASWMTREDRESDIQDYAKYLDKLHDTLNLKSNVRLHLLGFSQGVATAVRWFCKSQADFTSLTLWSGSFPPDMSIPLNSERLKKPKLFLIGGEDDAVVSAHQVRNLETEMLNQGLQPNLILYSGGHDIEADALADLIEKAET